MISNFILVTRPGSRTLAYTIFAKSEIIFICNGRRWSEINQLLPWTAFILCIVGVISHEEIHQVIAKVHGFKKGGALYKLIPGFMFDNLGSKYPLNRNGFRMWKGRVAVCDLEDVPVVRRSSHVFDYLRRQTNAMRV